MGGMDVLVQILSSALYALPNALGNMLGVLGAALLSVLLTSFIRGETTVFKTPYLVIIFVTGTLNPIFGVVGGASSVLISHLRREGDQRELSVLFTLLLFAIALWFLGVSVDDFTPQALR
jgi:hypothetical protein